MKGRVIARCATAQKVRGSWSRLLTKKREMTFEEKMQDILYEIEELRARNDLKGKGALDAVKVT
jgi:hypothetical protein